MFSYLLRRYSFLFYRGKITNLAYFVKLLVDYYENFTAPYNIFFLFNEYLTFNPWWHPQPFHALSKNALTPSIKRDNRCSGPL